MLHSVWNVRNYQYTIITSEKSKGLIYTAVEPWNRAQNAVMWYILVMTISQVFINGVCNFKNLRVLCLNCLAVRHGSENCLVLKIFCLWLMWFEFWGPWNMLWKFKLISIYIPLFDYWKDNTVAVIGRLRMNNFRGVSRFHLLNPAWTRPRQLPGEWAINTPPSGSSGRVEGTCTQWPGSEHSELPWLDNDAS
jgi:hypothetical protein